MEVKGTLKYRKVQRTPQTGENAGKKKWYATSVTDRRGCVISLWRTPFYFLPFHRYEIFKKHFYLQQSPNFHKLGLCLSAKDLYLCRKLL